MSHCKRAVNDAHVVLVVHVVGQITYNYLSLIIKLPINIQIVKQCPIF